MSDNICFIDFETTGSDLFYDEPIEFGAVLINRHFEIIESFGSSIRLEKEIPITQTAFNIHGIKKEMLLNSPSKSEVVSEFFRLFGTNYRLGGWNTGFDITMFRRLCHETNNIAVLNKIDYRHIEVQTLNFLANELGLLNDINSLNELTKHLKIERSSIHRALDDAVAVSKAYRRLMIMFDELKK